MLEESVSSLPTFWAFLTSWFTPTVFFVVLQLVIGTIYIISSPADSTRKPHHHEQDPQVAADFPHHHQQLARSPSVLQRLKSINFYSYAYRSQENQQTPDLQTHEREQPQIARSPSLLQRLKSINLYYYFPTEPISSKFTADTSVFHSTTHETVTHDDSHETQEHLQKHHLDDTAVAETGEDIEENDVVGQIQRTEHEASLDEIYGQLEGQAGHFGRSQSDTKPSSGEVPVKLPRKMKKSASTKSAFSRFKEDDIVENRRPASVRKNKDSGAAQEDDNDHEVDAKADDFINNFREQLKLERLDSIMRNKEMIGRGSGK